MQPDSAKRAERGQQDWMRNIMSFRWLYKAIAQKTHRPQKAPSILHAAAPAVPINSTGPVQDAAMESQGEHCPFLNRSDHRCAQHFNLDQLDYALEHCFDKYQTCQT